MPLCRIAAHGTREKVVATFDGTATVLDLRVRENKHSYRPLILMSLTIGREEAV